MLNLAEGVGKYSKPDKRRFYMTSRGSATESAALLDVLLRLKLVDEARWATGKQLLKRIVGMLVRLVQSCE